MHVWKGKYDPYDRTVRDKKYMRRFLLNRRFEYKKKLEENLLRVIEENGRSLKD